MNRFFKRFATGGILLTSLTLGLSLATQTVSAHDKHSGCETLHLAKGTNVSGIKVNLLSCVGQADPGTTLSVDVSVTGGGQVSLVSYQAPTTHFELATAGEQTVYSSQSTNGGTLTVQIPDCFFQVDLVIGSPIYHFGPPDNYYNQALVSPIPPHAIDRLVASADGGDKSCTAPKPSPTPTPTPTPVPTATPTPTPTPTPPLATPKAIPTATPTPRPTAHPTPSPTGKVSAATPTPTAAPILAKQSTGGNIPKPDTGAGNILPPAWLAGALLVQLGILVSWLAARRLHKVEVL